jgi:hypothetical protein
VKKYNQFHLVDTKKVVSIVEHLFQESKQQLDWKRKKLVIEIVSAIAIVDLKEGTMRVVSKELESRHAFAQNIVVCLICFLWSFVVNKCSFFCAESHSSTHLISYFLHFILFFLCCPFEGVPKKTNESQGTYTRREMQTYHS